jgi:hypothetical protein
MYFCYPDYQLDTRTDENENTSPYSLSTQPVVILYELKKLDEYSEFVSPSNARPKNR